MITPRQSAGSGTEHGYFAGRADVLRNRVAKLEAAVAQDAVRPEQRDDVIRRAWRSRLKALVPAFSAGEPVDVLAAELAVLGEGSRSLVPTDKGDSTYILFASLACLLGTAKADARSFFERAPRETDAVAMTVWLADGSDDEVDSMVCTPQYREGIEEAVQLHIDGRPEDAVDRLVTYVRDEWYWNHSEAAWFDSHKHVESGSFHGYWCFEGAATAKALGMGGAKFEGLEYFPMDMFLYENPS